MRMEKAVSTVMIQLDIARKLHIGLVVQPVHFCNHSLIIRYII